MTTRRQCRSQNWPIRRLLTEPLKLDSHPELFDAFFGNYRRVVYLSQVEDERLLREAKKAADRLELEFEHVHCGYGELETSLIEWREAK